MTKKKADPLTDLGAMCRDDRCPREDLHARHEVVITRGRRPQRTVIEVEVRQQQPTKARSGQRRGRTARRGWHQCKTCRGSGISSWAGRTVKCSHCENGFIFVGSFNIKEKK